ncbi:uncharacterized conserved protein [Rothia mucilaginosa DY-18]|uniref:Uncharacterized conserved protein n=1 Tax=Rothia mucilaginosa (strain DY-18) TaxID=680646 RepID=D2NP63_ROTMD|nr:uncharacterized conserved protein [Rothia mucilaginosa DY-18]
MVGRLQFRLPRETLLYLIKSGFQNVLSVRNTLLRSQSNTHSIQRTSTVLEAIHLIQMTLTGLQDDATTLPAAQARLHKTHIHTPLLVQLVIISHSTRHLVFKLLEQQLSTRTGNQIQAGANQGPATVGLTHTVLTVHKRRQQGQADVFHLRVQLAGFIRKRIAEVYQVHLRVLRDNRVHDRLSIRRKKDVVFGNQRPIGVTCNKVTPHLHMAKHATLLRGARVTMPTATEKLNVKFFISDVIIAVIHRRITDKALRRRTHRIERVETVRAIQAQNILQNLCHLFPSIAHPENLSNRRSQRLMMSFQNIRPPAQQKGSSILKISA